MKSRNTGGNTMALEMDEQTFLNFYKNTFVEYSKKAQKYICNLLEKEGMITYDEQQSYYDNEDVEYFDFKIGFEKIISETTPKEKFSNFYEKIEFTKLYKYSVPLFFDGDIEKSIDEHCKNIENFNESYKPPHELGTSINEAKPIYYKEGKNIFIKFVLQKSYYKADNMDTIDYRYPIVIYFDKENNVLDIRYDSLKYSGSGIDSTAFYQSIVEKIIKWIKEDLQISIFECDHCNCIDTIKNDSTGKVKIYKQMMEMSSGGAAELTASENMDYLLPFTGELRELIDDNEKMFENAPEIKNLLLQYLSDKEATADYPYIYVKWVNAVDSKSYVVKITFDCFANRYTLLQHNTGKCNDLGMERMNNAIKYICESKAFIKGEEI